MDDNTDIAKLIRTLELSRTVSVICQVVLVLAGIPLLAVLIGKAGFEPVPVISVVIALGIGVAFLAWHRRRTALTIALLRMAEAHKADLGEAP